MDSKNLERRLAAIVAADVAGYSRLMEQDEAGTLAVLKLRRRDILNPLVERHRGRIIKLMGDGVLAEFGSVVNAVQFAAELQRDMTAANAGLPVERSITLRVGVNLGDLMVEGNDLYGEGVNIAARLQAIAQPGGICVSGKVYDEVRRKLNFGFEDLGEQTVKNIATPLRVYRVATEIERPHAGETWSGMPPPLAAEQEIHFCTATDGVRLAYSRLGRGPPLVKSGNWMTHLEFDLDGPILGRFHREFSSDHTLIRYDARGNGLSDRDVEVSFEATVSDLETVIDAAGLDRFALIGMSQGCAISVAYAARHRERVTHLVLFGGYAIGWAKRMRTTAEQERGAAMLTLVRVGWGQENPAFRQLFTSQFMPEGTKEQMDWFNELQRVSTSPEDAARMLQAQGDIDVTALLPQITAPTLVMHARDDPRVPFDAGRQLAAGIPGARFVPLPGRNHMILDHQPAFPRFVQEIRTFLAT